MAADLPTSHTVEKIGGTSMAEPDVVLQNVVLGNGRDAAPYDRAFVVSAYDGITDGLLEHKRTGDPGVAALFADAESDSVWEAALAGVAEQMRRINSKAFGDRRTRAVADDFVQARVAGVRDCLSDLSRLCSYGHFRLEQHLVTVRELLAALGEAHSAHNTALLLQGLGVKARFVDLTGWRDETHPALDERFQAAFADIDLSRELPIVTGYAQCRGGLMQRFDRGYSEVTMSRIAVLTGAREAIIHKEFPLSSADPRIVEPERAHAIARTNYDVADQLSNLGMEAIHPQAAKGLRQAGIPLRVTNTFEPSQAGTIISGGYVSETPRVEIVTGIREVVALEFLEQEMVGKKGYDAAILEALTRHRLRIVTKASNANTITHYLAGPLKSVERVAADLQHTYPTARVGMRKVSIVAVIGSDLGVPGLTAAAVSALAEADIEILGMHQLMRRVDIQFVVEQSPFEAAIKALHKKLIEEGACLHPDALDQRAA